MNYKIRKNKMCVSYSAVHTFMIFQYSQAFMHHFTGLFGTNINLNNDQLPVACQHSW